MKGIEIFDKELIDIKISEFKSALGDKSQTNQLIVQKYITHGTPHIFKYNEAQYFELKYEISSHFSENPESVRIVGSAKLGFSIAPHKLWKPFSLDSDIDIVIISKVIFEKFWNDLYDFNIALTSRNETEQRKYNTFLKYFFKGWLRPDLFPFRYPATNEWFDYFKSISYGKYGPQKIAAAIYYDFNLFEKYHIQNINKLRIGVEEND
jgi:hypothetical protein